MKLTPPNTTPGPWIIMFKPNGYPDKITAPNESEHEPGNVVDILRKASFCMPCCAETQANAQAIAAVPDLLAALEQFATNELSDANCASVEVAARRIRCIAQAALLKAGYTITE